jgi:hypothetical protein
VLTDDVVDFIISHNNKWERRWVLAKKSIIRLILKP